MSYWDCESLRVEIKNVNVWCWVLGVGWDPPAMLKNTYDISHLPRIIVMGCICSVWISTQRCCPDHSGANRSHQETDRAILINPAVCDNLWRSVILVSLPLPDWSLLSRSGGGSQGREDSERDLGGVWPQHRDQPGRAEDVLQAGGQVPHSHPQLQQSLGRLQLGR